MGTNIVIRVGFILAVSKEWMGGVNYYKNLLFAIHSLPNKSIEPVVLIGYKTEEWIVQLFEPYAIIIQHPIFDRKSLIWFLWKITHRLFDSNFILEKILTLYKINVLSHSNITGLKSCVSINWIPDFQHLHLPDMFQPSEVTHRNTRLIHLIERSNAIVLSSFNAFDDFKIFAPAYIHKAHVLQFISQPDPRYDLLQQTDKIRVCNMYQITQPFFYLPNQFWAHKNHEIVFEAVRILKEKKINVLIVCSGYMHDYRNTKHLTHLMSFIQKHQLHNHIKFLDLIPYENVFALMKFSLAVINPSLFEGWSSTVEECKSIGKNIILSDIPVHREQYPNAHFFDPKDATKLASILLETNYLADSEPNQKTILERTQKFAETYQQIVYSSIKETF